MIAFRTEHDSFGDIDVPAERLWGAQTQRSLAHFAISTERMPRELIYALAQVKRAAALVNRDLGLLESAIAETIIEAADEVLTGKYDEEFPLSVWQTGSGTQTTMNMNEVLANRASELRGAGRGSLRSVHPNDHGNMGQSSNDVFPTAMHLAAAQSLNRKVISALQGLRDALAEKSKYVQRHCQNRPHPFAGCHATHVGAGIFRLRCATGSWHSPPAASATPCI
jgi:fumarate hydratase class II